MLDTDAVTVLMKTLADPTRRGVYERIARGEAPGVGELAKSFNVSQPAISQHLKALREGGLVSERREGRRVIYAAEPQALAPLIDWLDVYGAFWRERFANLENMLKEMDR
jgi:DNA-binding transcriptional ArsR family regulator